MNKRNFYSQLNRKLKRDNYAAYQYFKENKLTDENSIIQLYFSRNVTTLIHKKEHVTVENKTNWNHCYKPNMFIITYDSLIAAYKLEISDKTVIQKEVLNN